MGKKIDSRVEDLEQDALARMIAKLFKAGILTVADGRFVALQEDAANLAAGLNEAHRRGLLRVAAR